ncbi:hypothetical protein ACSSWA_01990 [Melioribacter sp. Ez-97]|uniref:hypothetical protein n=1 Tax=Melioribacter sp. Ez-97 TaxID=3423434 RepID=UPI003EDB23E9
MKPVKENKIILLALVLLPALFYGCEQKIRLDDRKAAEVYVSVLIINEKYGAESDSSKAYKKELFKKYDIDEKQFDDYLNSLKEDKEKWERFFDLSEEYLNRLKAEDNIN